MDRLIGTSDENGIKKAIYINENQRGKVRISGIFAIVHIIIGISYVVLDLIF